jgi:protein-S-isoprenylcysteine O-methyltransferase Ste14
MAEKKRHNHRTIAKVLELSILIVLPIIFHCLVPVIQVIDPPYVYLGLVLMLLGLALMTWAAMHFRKAGTSFQLHGETSVLVTTGPFRFSRNPIYLGMLIWLLGMAILLGSLIAFLFPVILFLLANFFIVPLEESALEARIGEQVIEYRCRVRRWL